MRADFRGKGTSPTNHCWCQKTRVIAVSCGVKISAVQHLVLSQYTRLPDIQTDRRTNRPNCDSNTVRCITCSRTVKTVRCTYRYALWSLSATNPRSTNNCTDVLGIRRAPLLRYVSRPICQLIGLLTDVNTK